MAAANSLSVSAPFWRIATNASSSDAMPARSADEWGQGLGQRPWVAGIYKRKADATELCVVACVEIKFQAPHADDAMTLISTQVVAGEFPHPLANQTLWNLNGAPTWSVATSVHINQIVADVAH